MAGLFLHIFEQACRGNETDRGQIDPSLLGSRSPSSSPSKSTRGASHEKRKRTHGTDKDTIPFSKYRYGEVYKARPTWEDMIIAYSTIPGFASIRDHDHGETLLCRLYYLLTLGIIFFH